MGDIGDGIPVLDLEPKGRCYCMCHTYKNMKHAGACCGSCQKCGKDRLLGDVSLCGACKEAPDAHS